MAVPAHGGSIFCGLPTSMLGALTCMAEDGSVRKSRMKHENLKWMTRMLNLLEVRLW